jgi:hypothetical protein
MTVLLLKELNQEGSTNKLLQCALETIQTEAGIGSPILEDNWPLIYIEWGWIPSIREFLQHINARITNKTAIPLRYRQYDSYTMDAEILLTLTRKEQILINRFHFFGICRNSRQRSPRYENDVEST